MVENGINCAVESDPSSVCVVMSNGMYQKSIFCLALYLAIAIQLSSAENNARDLTDHPCTRRDGNPGYCMRASKCPQMIPLLKARKANILTPQQTTYIHNSGTCTNRKELCCEYREEEKYQEEQGLKHLLDQECGLWGTSKVFGGSEIVLMTRPWMALLEFKIDENVTDFLCGGTLIHKRFVLTAAHCFTDYPLVSIRLGEHQISSLEDCRFVKGKEKCASPVLNMNFESVFIYEGFNEIDHFNDIALVKLSADVEFKKHIRPICLPVTEALQQKVTNNTDFNVTGWGRNENSIHSDVPLEALVKSQNATECQKAFNQEIRSTQLCVGQKGKDSCNGDSGGPLSDIQYFKELQRFIQYGIVSYGSKFCGNGSPGVYTSVSKFIPWIADKIATKL